MPIDSRQIRIFAVLLVAVVGLLTGLWFFVLRTNYVPIYQNIRESDASLIVAELDSAGIAYRLENDGHDILVAEGEAPAARLAVAGAELPMGGTTGFELFNENEIGLTEFAQKINFQRAIQGELARTIMMMDGVEFARVHLALPERTLFRSEQELATAAVTVEMAPTRRLSAGSVAGIRQLVASSVPGLTLENVSVLNQSGDLMSHGTELRPGPQVQSEREAVESLLTIRAREAISQVLPQQTFEIQISAFERITEAATPSKTEPQADAASSALPRTRALGLEARALRALVRTPQVLGPEERGIISATLAKALELSTEAGDVIDFSTGALSPTAAPASEPSSDWETRADDQPSRLQSLNKATSLGEWDLGWLLSSWFLIPLALLVVVLLAMRPRRQLSAAETEEFAEILRSTALEPEQR